MNYRKGDIVSVLGIVRHDEGDDDGVFVDITDRHDTLWVSPKGLTLVAAKFEVGDKCQFMDFSGIVLAISDGHAWIDMGGGNYCTRQLTSIERIESDE